MLELEGQKGRKCVSSNSYRQTDRQTRRRIFGQLDPVIESYFFLLMIVLLFAIIMIAACMYVHTCVTRNPKWSKILFILKYVLPSYLEHGIVFVLCHPCLQSILCIERAEIEDRQRERERERAEKIHIIQAMKKPLPACLI